MTLQSFSFVLTDQVLKGAALLLLASLASLAYRRASAARRNALWLSLFAALFLLPFTYLAQPQWSWLSPSMPKRPALVLPPAEAGVFQTSATGLAAKRLPGLPDWKNALAGLWGAGAAFLIMRRLAASWLLRRLLRASEVAQNSPLSSIFAEMARRFVPTRRARLRLSSACPAPMTWGVWRPIFIGSGPASGKRSPWLSLPPLSEGSRRSWMGIAPVMASARCPSWQARRP